MMEFKLAGHDKPIIIVKTKVNGKGPFDFAVDTGASVTVVSKPLADKLGISEDPSTLKKAHCCGGTMDSSLLTVGSVQVGNVMAKEIQVALMDLSTISKCVGIELEGIIGHSFMKDYRVIIDYPNRHIFFRKTRLN
jgi:predicted aspartyl protease